MKQKINIDIITNREGALILKKAGFKPWTSFKNHLGVQYQFEQTKELYKYLNKQI